MEGHDQQRWRSFNRITVRRMAFQSNAFQGFQLTTLDMAAPLNAFQVGIFNRLTGYSALTTELGGAKVYDHVPQGTAAPYVLIGDDTLIESDTKTGNGWELTITVHTWDFLRAGRKTVKEIMEHIYDALHKQETNVTVSGFSLTYLHCEYQETFQERAEGATDMYYHGVQRFRALITDTTS